MRCGFTFPLEQFPTEDWGRGHHWLCEQCWVTNPLIIRVAAIAADGLVRLRAIDALRPRLEAVARPAAGGVMAAELAVSVTMLTPTDTPERGWCDPCALPSMLLWHVAIEAGDYLLGDKLTTLRLCVECGHESWT